jgi:hypothetical protein
MNPPRPQHPWTELAVRENDGLSVSLLWSSATNRVKVAIVDAQLDERFEIDVASADALAAFYHPFAYAAALGASFGEARSHTFERSTVR